MQETNNKGFTLMEIIIAIAVITTALVTLIALIFYSVSGIKLGKSTLVATNLAQEGIEIVRNIRDSNWIALKRRSDNWNDGLEPGDYRAQYNRASLLSFSNMSLKIDNNGFYQYDNGNNTPFYRKITITQTENNWIKVISEVTWWERGRNKNIRAQAKLYNWLEE